MPNKLPLPSELWHLIEKREDTDRRVDERRADNEPSQPDVDEGSASAEDQRTGSERRQADDRREG